MMFPVDNMILRPRTGTFLCPNDFLIYSRKEYVDSNIKLF